MIRSLGSLNINKSIYMNQVRRICFLWKCCYSCWIWGFTFSKYLL